MREGVSRCMYIPGTFKLGRLVYFFLHRKRVEKLTGPGLTYAPHTHTHTFLTVLHASVDVRGWQFCIQACACIYVHSLLPHK